MDVTDKDELERINKERVLAGLEPLDLSESEPESESEIATRNYEQRRKEDLQKRQDEQNRLILKKARDRKELHRQLVGDSLGDGEDVDWAVKFAERLKRASKDSSTSSQAKQPKQNEHTGPPAPAYTQDDMHGLKVSHNLQDFDSERILTLKDTSEDELENRELVVKQLVKDKARKERKAKGYRGLQESDSDDQGFVIGRNELHGLSGSHGLKKGDRFGRDEQAFGSNSGPLPSSKGSRLAGTSQSSPRETSYRGKSAEETMIEANSKDTSNPTFKKKPKTKRKERVETSLDTPIEMPEIVLQKRVRKVDQSETFEPVRAKFIKETPAQLKERIERERREEEEEERAEQERIKALKRNEEDENDDRQVELMLGNRLGDFLARIQNREPTSRVDEKNGVVKPEETEVDDVDSSSGVLLNGSLADHNLTGDDGMAGSSHHFNQQTSEPTLEPNSATIAPISDHPNQSMQSQQTNQQDYNVSEIKRFAQSEQITQSNDAPSHSAQPTEAITEDAPNTTLGGILKELKRSGQIAKKSQDQKEGEETFAKKQAWLLERQKAESDWERLLALKSDASTIDPDLDRKIAAAEQYATVGVYEQYEPDVKIKYVENGREQSQKEAWKTLSHQFHGRSSGINKTNKQLAKLEHERRQQLIAAGASSHSLDEAFYKRAEKAGTSLMVLESGSRGMVTDEVEKPVKIKQVVSQKRSKPSRTSISIEPQDRPAPEPEPVYGFTSIKEVKYEDEPDQEEENEELPTFVPVQSHHKAQNPTKKLALPVLGEEKKRRKRI